MPTRHGWTVLAGALAALVIGRVFAIVELFVIGIGLAAAVGAAVVSVRVREPRLSITRWIHPSVLSVGDTGRVDLLVHNEHRSRSPRVDVSEPVGPVNSARIVVAPLAPGDQVTAGYRVPASRRGVLTIGPLEVEWSDQFGLASAYTLAVAEAEIMVAPRTVDLAMPAIGQGVLGRHLLAMARRLGPGEFHSLRDYAPGDEPRSIHWRASARSEELKVRQHTSEGVRRCIVVLDRDARAQPPDDPDAFERAVVAAASLVQAGDRGGLTTRFVTSVGVDLRGPEVATQTLRVLAPIMPGEPLGEIGRDPGEGLGLVIVVTASPDSEAWRRTEQLVDPTITRVGVFTNGRGSGARLHADASSIESFARTWHVLAGGGAFEPARDARSTTEASVRAAAVPAGDPADIDREWRRVST